MVYVMYDNNDDDNNNDNNDKDIIHIHWCLR